MHTLLFTYKGAAKASFSYPWLLQTPAGEIRLEEGLPLIVRVFREAAS